MNDQRGRMMESTPVPKLLIQFSIPTIVGMLVNALYNVVDRIFLGPTQIGRASCRERV